MSIRDLIKNKTARERAKITGQEIAKFNHAGTFTDNQYGVTVEIISLKYIEIAGQHGVEILAKGWRGTDQLGFGKDGTVEIERFRIFSPNPLVKDASGSIDLSTTFEEREIVKFAREDPVEAIKLELAPLVATIGKVSDSIIKGKTGSTVSTFKPDASPETSTVDGDLVRSAEATWDLAHDHTSGNGGSDNGNFFSIRVKEEAGGGADDYDIERLFMTLDTSAIGSDTVDSAFIDLFPALGLTNGDNDGLDYMVVVASTPATNTAIISGDFDQIGSTAFSETIDLGDTTQDELLSVDGKQLDFNSTGLAAIDTSGISKFAIREGHDFEDNSVAAGSQNRIVFASRDGGTAGEDPRLVVTHSTPTLAIDVNDSVTLAEDIVMLLTSFINVNDAITVAEDVAVEQINLINVNDSITLTESVTVENPTLPVEVNDAITVAESVTLLIPFLLIDINDTVSVTEDTTIDQPIEVSVSDTISVAESVTLLIPVLFLTVNDAISLAEDTTMLLTSFIDVNDSITLVELVSTTPQINLDINLSDSITLTEHIHVDVTTVWDFRDSISNTWTDDAIVTNTWDNRTDETSNFD